MMKHRSSAIAGTLALLLSCSATVYAQTVDRLELVASDGSLGDNATIPNNWGGHQPRIIHHNDGTIRLVYLKNINGVLYWQARHRLTSGGWVDDGSPISTFDDVSLVRNNQNDNAYVIAWPNSVPTLYNLSNPGTPVAIPGSWPYSLAKNRQYGNTGIASDGTLCLKVAYEAPTTPIPTSQLNTMYSCAPFDTGTQTFSWSGTIESHYIGPRYVYDYLHVNPAQHAPGMYGTSKRDLYYTASNIPNSKSTYVKNGLRTYATGLSSTGDWAQFDFVPEIPPPNPNDTSVQITPPEAVNQDVLIDSRGRQFVAYNITNPVPGSPNGSFLYVTDASGNLIQQGPWPGAAIDSYGLRRFYEDDKGRLWLVWINPGNRRPEVKIYPIIEGSNSFSLGTPVDLSSAFGLIVPDTVQGYSLYLAAPRGGNARSPYIDAIFNACGSLQYNADKTPVTFSQCYATSQQQVYYVRIALPN